MQNAEGLILLETKVKYAIWENCRYVFNHGKIWGFSKPTITYHHLSLMSISDILRITSVQATLWYPRNRKEICCNSVPGFATNQTQLKIQVSNGYLKGFCKLIYYCPLRVFWPKKSILELKYRWAQNIFRKIKFWIFLTWCMVFVISVIVSGW